MLAKNLSKVSLQRGWFTHEHYHRWILGTSLWLKKAVHGILSRRFSAIKNKSISRENHAHSFLWCKRNHSQWTSDTEWRLILKDFVKRYLANTEAVHSQRTARKEESSLASRQRMTALQSNSRNSEKAKIRSCCTPSIQSGLGSIRFLIVPEDERGSERSKFTIWWRTWSSCSECDQISARKFP